MINLKNKTAIVVGASKGIGKEISLNLAKNGCTKIFIVSRNLDALNKVKTEILKDYKLDVHCYKLDISNPLEVENIFSQILLNTDSIDILINNAGITKDNIIMRMPIKDWNDIINTNLSGYFYCCKYISKRMIKQKFGRIINISSIIGINGNAGQINYSSSKAGIIGLTKSLSKELGKRNITVNAIAPGFINSDMTNSLAEANKNEYLNDISLNRFGEAEDVANLVSFLASDNASYITGQIINIDGGIN